MFHSFAVSPHTFQSIIKAILKYCYYAACLYTILSSMKKVNTALYLQDYPQYTERMNNISGIMNIRMIVHGA